MINPPHCVYCDAEPQLMPYDDIYICVECGETSYRPDNTWLPLSTTNIIAMPTDDVKYWLNRFLVTRNYYQHRK